jgi:hypothetical protein
MDFFDDDEDERSGFSFPFAPPCCFIAKVLGLGSRLGPGLGGVGLISIVFVFPRLSITDCTAF